MAELKTFLFTDICRSVDLKNEMVGRSVTERDMAFIEQILTPHRARIEAHLEEHTGRVVSTAGDGHFLVFNNTIQAALWATDVQRSHAEDPILTPGGGSVEVRISIHVGVPQVDPAAPDNFVGKSVDYASRLNDHATGGQILVSRSVMAILEDIGLEGISFHPHGKRNLKGIGHVEIHEMQYDDHGPRTLRQQPASHSDRQWTVIPTMGFGNSNAGALATAPMLKRVGNYELEALLGSGGMGDVYKGRHTQFGRVRAIKVIKPQFMAAGNEEVIRRFYQEIKAIGTLEHKHIVVAIDSSSPADRLHYLVMEYLEGVSVHDLVDQRGPLSVPDACEIVRQAARGLQYIHRNGMVHRDIKPSNLMITLVDGEGAASKATDVDKSEPVEGVVKILDLGLALLAGDTHDRLTRYDNKAMGTGMYMSPEQWKTTSVDIRADIYSLGCTLYHLLSGNPPFYDSDLRPEKAHEKSQVPPIRSNNIPRKLWDVIEKMLAKKPEDRYPTPADVAAELTPFCEGQNLVAVAREYLEPTTVLGSAYRHTRIDSGARIETWLSRASHLYPTRRWLLARGLPVLAMLGGLGLLFWSMQQSRQQAIANALQQAQDALPVAAETASLAVGEYITQRFKILQEAAEDPELVRMVEGYSEETAREELEKYPLAKWIREHRLDNSDRTPTDSWFINNRAGVQIARHPLIVDATQLPEVSFLENYAYRDYFHGQGKDLKKDSVEPIEPTEVPILSAVYLSSNTGNLKVAFSVPIWRKAVGKMPPQVLGVLSMSAELGAFEVLNPTVQKGKDVVLVDLREDFLAGQDVSGQRGLILNHPFLKLKEKESHPPRVEAKVLGDMQSKPEGFIAAFHDPLALKTKTEVSYWGAFQAVSYTIRDVQTDSPQEMNAGWMVLVQAPAIE